MKNGIVIPCYNEEERLDLSKIEDFINRNARHIICFVNNGSDDETLTLLKNFQRRLLSSHKCLATQVLICNLPENVSRVDAIQSGMDHLLVNTLVNNIQVGDTKLTENIKPLVINKRALRSSAA